MTTPNQTLYTLGHSNRTKGEFREVLTSWQIELLVDVRRYPQSRRYPWFNQGNLEDRLERSGIEYTHLPEVGGFRDEPDDIEPDQVGGLPSKWRAYGHYMSTDQYRNAIGELMDMATQISPAAIMCAEREPDQCHRQFICDVFALSDWSVRHIIDAETGKSHEPRPEASKVGPGQVAYPARQLGLSL